MSDSRKTTTHTFKTPQLCVSLFYIPSWCTYSKYNKIICKCNKTESDNLAYCIHVLYLPIDSYFFAFLPLFFSARLWSCFTTYANYSMVGWVVNEWKNIYVIHSRWLFRLNKFYRQYPKKKRYSLSEVCVFIFAALLNHTSLRQGVPITSIMVW